MTQKTIVSILILVISACSSRPIRQVSSTDEVAEKEDLLDFNLVREGNGGEAWKGGSRPSEVAGFLEDSKAVGEASSKLAKKNDGQRGRVFHQKSHGCLTGKIKIHANLDPSLQRGLLAHPGAEYDLITRFSNGIGLSHHDALPDVRGVALKIFDDNAPDHPIDLLMTNAPNPFGRDQAQFVEFMKANLEGNIAVLKFINSQKKQDPRELNYLTHFIRSTVGLIKNPAYERYWSGHPYTFGSDTFIKFNILPEGQVPLTPNRDAAVAEYSAAMSQVQDDDSYQRVEKRYFQPRRIIKDFVKARMANPQYLRDRLQQLARDKNIHFTLAVQLWKDENTTPVENTLIEWKESDSPSIPVATITLDKQYFDVDHRDKECAALRFSPGNYLADQRPAGNIGRGRIFTYMTSQDLRGADTQQPTKGIVTSWRRGDHVIQ
jgi:catalase